MPAYKDEKTGKWYCQFYYTDWQGNRKHTSKRGFARKKDAEEWEAKKRYEIQPQKITMSYLLDRFLEHCSSKVTLGTLKESTYEQYIDFIKKSVRPFFNDINIENITISHINKWQMTLTPKNKPLAPGTRRLYKTRLSTIFNFAMRQYGLQRNPVKLSEVVKGSKVNKRAALWSFEEYSIFYHSLENEQQKIVFNLMFWAGLRIGEVLALSPNDFTDDFKIVVNKNLVKLKKGYVVSTPKTHSSIRNVAIPRFLYYQVINYIRRIPFLENDEPIFFYNRYDIYYILNKQAKKLNLPHVSPHILRHSYASILLNLTKDPTVVSKQIGHANPQITLSIYSHMLPGEEVRAVDLLENVLLQNPSPDKEIIDINTQKK